MLYALLHQIQMLYSCEYNLSTSGSSALHLLCFMTEELQVQGLLDYTPACDRGGMRAQMLLSVLVTHTDPFPASLCLAFSTLSLFRFPAQTFQTSFVQFTSLRYLVTPFINLSCVPCSQWLYLLGVLLLDSLTLL